MDSWLIDLGIGIVLILASHLVTRIYYKSQAKQQQIEAKRNHIEELISAVCQDALTHYTREQERENTQQSAALITHKLKVISLKIRQLACARASAKAALSTSYRRLHEAITVHDQFMDENRIFCSATADKVTTITNAGNEFVANLDELIANKEITSSH